MKNNTAHLADKRLDSEHVVMLVNNPCTHDSRVIKSAEAVAQMGRRVTVLCRAAPDGSLPLREERNGVIYERMEPKALKWNVLKRYILGRNVGSADHQQGGVSTSARILVLPRLLFLTSVIAMVRSVGALISAVRICKKAVSTVAHTLVRAVIRLISIFRKAVRDAASAFARKANAIIRKIGLSVRRNLPWFLGADDFTVAAEQRLYQLAPDLVHAHDLSNLPAAGRVARLTGAKLIYDSHELEMDRNAEYTRFVQYCRHRLEKRYIRKADAVVTVSDSIATHLATAYDVTLPTVVMNAPSLRETTTSFADTDLRSKVGVRHDTPLAVYVGSVTIYRGLEQMVEALCHDSCLHFAAVGPRRIPTEKALIELAKSVGVSARFHLVDPVAPDEVISFIRSADVSVLPIQNVCLSYYYCMPNKLLESVFAGLPVAVADLVELRRFVEKTGTGVVMDEKDPQAITQAINHIINNRNQYVVPKDERQKLATEYGWEQQSSRLRHLYNQILKSNPADGRQL